MGNQKKYGKNETTSYNMKLERYPGRMSITCYDQLITKLTEEEKERRKYDKKTAKHYEPDNGNTLQRTWNNPKTGKVEIIPEGWYLESLQFGNEIWDRILPEEKYLPEGFYEDFDGWRSESGTWDEDGHFHPDEVITLE